MEQTTTTPVRGRYPLSIKVRKVYDSLVEVRIESKDGEAVLVATMTPEEANEVAVDINEIVLALTGRVIVSR